MGKRKFKFILQNSGNEYENQKVNLREDVNKSIARLVESLKRLGVKHLNLIGLGTSLTSGFSATDLIKPFLNRAEDLKKILAENGITLNLYNFSTPQKNREKEIHKWIEKDVPMSELNRRTVSSLDALGIKVDTENDYPLEPENDACFRDANKDSGNDSMNIVVYNGFTGSFLDVPSRSGGPDAKSMILGALKKGLLRLRLFKAFKQDRIGAEAIFQTIQAQNPNTQVYVQGIPLIKGVSGFLTKLFLINRKIKNVCKKFSNVVYVPPAPINGTHKCSGLYNQEEGKQVFDFHPNQPEYLERLHRCISSMADNCVKTAFCNEMTNALSNESGNAEYPHNAEEVKLRWNTDHVVNTVLAPIIKKYNLIFADEKERVSAYSRFKSIFERDLPHESWFISESGVVNSLDNGENKTL